MREVCHPHSSYGEIFNFTVAVGERRGMVEREGEREKGGGGNG